MTHVNPILNQRVFRNRADSGNEATPTWPDIANANWTQDVDVDFRVRFEIAETATSTNAATPTLVLYFDHNSAGYVAVSATTPIQFGAFTGATDADATTQQIGSGTFVAGELDSDASVTANAGIQGTATEMEYCLNIDSAQVANTDTILLRVQDTTTALDAWDNTPTITVNEAAGGLGIPIAAYHHMHHNSA